MQDRTYGVQSYHPVGSDGGALSGPASPLLLSAMLARLCLCSVNVVLYCIRSDMKARGDDLVSVESAKVKSIRSC